jgi:hypothetical protein
VKYLEKKSVRKFKFFKNIQTRSLKSFEIFDIQNILQTTISSKLEVVLFFKMLHSKEVCKLKTFNISSNH